MKKGFLFLLLVSCFLFPGVLAADECMEGDCDNGKGTGFTEDGKIYEGEWKDGYPHGKGTLYVSREEVIKGEWAEGKLVKEKKDDKKQE